MRRCALILVGIVAIFVLGFLLGNSLMPVQGQAKPGGPREGGRLLEAALSAQVFRGRVLSDCVPRGPRCCVGRGAGDRGAHVFHLTDDLSCVR